MSLLFSKKMHSTFELGNSLVISGVKSKPEPSHKVICKLGSMASHSLTDSSANAILLSASVSLTLVSCAIMLEVNSIGMLFAFKEVCLNFLVVGF